MSKRRRYINGKKKERVAAKAKSGSKKNSKRSKVVAVTKSVSVTKKQDVIVKPRQQPAPKVTVPVSAPPPKKNTKSSVAACSSDIIAMTPGKKTSNMAILRQRLSALKQSAKRINPATESRRKAEEELQKSLRKWKQDRERAASSVKKSSATAHRLREQQAARAKALEAAKAAKAKAKKKPRYASKQRIAMLSRPKQINKNKAARMRKVITVCCEQTRRYESFFLSKIHRFDVISVILAKNVCFTSKKSNYDFDRRSTKTRSRSRRRAPLSCSVQIWKKSSKCSR